MLSIFSTYLSTTSMRRRGDTTATGHRTAQRRCLTRASCTSCATRVRIHAMLRADSSFRATSRALKVRTRTPKCSLLQHGLDCASQRPTARRLHSRCVASQTAWRTTRWRSRAPSTRHARRCTRSLAPSPAFFRTSSSTARTLIIILGLRCSARSATATSRWVAGALLRALRGPPRSPSMSSRRRARPLSCVKHRTAVLSPTRPISPRQSTRFQTDGKRTALRVRGIIRAT